jgi:hypothetical protein
MVLWCWGSQLGGKGQNVGGESSDKTSGACGEKREKKSGGKGKEEKE